MATPRTVSRSQPDPFYSLPWNAMVDLCAVEPLDKCTPVQRIAALAFWYMSEVNNGGHFQYFVNKAKFPHEEVIAALIALGATHSASVLTSVLQQLGGTLPPFPESVEEYLLSQERFDLGEYDEAFF